MSKTTIKKGFLFIIFTLVIITTSIIIYRTINDSSNLDNIITQELAFIQNNGSNYCVHPFKNDSVYVVVLPSYWDLEEIYMINSKNISSHEYNKSCDIPISGQKTQIKLSHNMQLDLNRIGIDKVITIKFYQSSVSSILINTESGSMADIDSSTDKSHEESGNIIISNQTGQKCYEGTLESIKGHGNYTWIKNDDKKSYNIEFKKNQSLLGLKENDNFCLIANNADISQMRNWIAYTTSQLINPDNSVGCEYVALWTNGNYRGLYLLTNKINRKLMNISNLEKETKKCNYQSLKKFATKTIYEDKNQQYADDEMLKGLLHANNPKNISGGYLLEMHPKNTRDIHLINSLSGFRSKYETRYGFKSPKYATLEQVNYVKRLYDRMADALYSENGYNSQGMYYTSMIDVESFAKLYLLQELFANSDCNKSVFIYKDKDDSLFYAGPLWDMDLTMGCGGRGYEIPEAYYVRMPYKLRADEARINIYPGLWATLCKHKDFIERVEDTFSIYKDTIRSYFTGTNCKVDSMANIIKNDIFIDRLRSKGSFDLAEWQANVEAIKKFMNKRISFFSEAWYSSSDSDYINITIDTKWHTSYTLIQIPITKGTYIKLPQFEGKYAATLDGKKYNSSKPFYDDTTIIYNDTETTYTEKLLRKFRQYISFI